MKKLKPISWLIFILILLAASITSHAVEDWPHPEEMEFEELDYTIKEADKYTLENGLTVYLMENHDLPLIKGQAYLKAGAVYSPSAKIGLAEMTADLLRTGGAAGLSPQTINEKLEFLSASIEMSAQSSYVNANFSSLSDNIKEVLDLYNKILRRPDFLPERIDLSQQKMKESIRRRNDQPVQIAVREFVKKMAEGHPTGKFPTLKTVNAVTREDLVSFHQHYYQPQDMVLAVTGDFQKENMLNLIKNTLGSWEKEPIDYPQLPEFNPNPEPKVYHVQKPFQQSIILLGHPAVKFDNEKYAALNLGNRILGGTGSSRLFSKIRSERGLAYSVGSQLTQGFDFPGYFYVYSISRANKTGTVIDLIMQEIEKIKEEPVTTEEFEDNRQAILNQAVFRYNTPHQITTREALIEFMDLKPNYYQKYINQIKNLTPEAMCQQINEEFKPDQSIIMVVGNSQLFDKPLHQFGEVENIELKY